MRDVENMSHKLHINNPTLKNHHKGGKKNLERTLILKSNIHGNNECVRSTTLVSVNEMERQQHDTTNWKSIS